jgi:hypothetical protein
MMENRKQAGLLALHSFAGALNLAVVLKADELPLLNLLCLGLNIGFAVAHFTAIRNYR